MLSKAYLLIAIFALFKRFDDFPCSISLEENRTLFCPSDSSIAAQLSQPWQYDLVLENHGDSSRLHSWRLAYVILAKNNHLLAECHTVSRYVQSLKSFSYLYQKWVDQHSMFGTLRSQIQR